MFWFVITVAFFVVLALLPPIGKANPPKLAQVFEVDHNGKTIDLTGREIYGFSCSYASYSGQQCYVMVSK